MAALLVDLPEDGLVRGQVGTVVEILPPDAVMLEFVDDEGQTYALVSLDTGKVVALQQRAAHHAA